MRADAPAALRDALAANRGVHEPVWRGSPAAKVLKGTTFAVVSGTTSREVAGGSAARRCRSTPRSCRSPDYRTGIAAAARSQGRRVLRRPHARPRAPSTPRRARISWSSIACSRTNRSRSRWRAAMTTSGSLVDRALSQLYASNGFASCTGSGSARSTTGHARSSCGARPGMMSRASRLNPRS